MKPRPLWKRAINAAIIVMFGVRYMATAVRDELRGAHRAATDRREP